MLISDAYISIESCKISSMTCRGVSYLVPTGAASWLDIALLVLEFVVRKEPFKIPIWDDVLCKKKEERGHRKRLGKVQGRKDI